MVCVVLVSMQVCKSYVVRYHTPPMNTVLKFSTHVGHAVAKGNQILGLIKRSFVYRDSDVIKRLFTAQVWPHLEYANVVSRPCFNKKLIRR